MKKKFILLFMLLIIFAVIITFGGLNNPLSLASSIIEKVNITNASVTADYLNVRQGPAKTFNIINVLKRGDTVTVFGKVSDWYAVYEPNNRLIGVCSSEYLKLMNTNNADQGTTNKSNKSTQLIESSSDNLNMTKDEQKLMELINKARVDANIAKLHVDPLLCKVAKLKVKDMVNKNYFSHQSPIYGSPFDMMRQYGICFKGAGENIAGNQSVEGAFSAWINASGNKKNILNESYNCTGIGVVDSPVYGKMIVEEFIKK